MWIEKRKDRLYAVERFIDPITGKNVRVLERITKDTARERKRAAAELQNKWDQMHRKVSDLKLSEIGELYFADAKKKLKEQTYIRDTGQFRIVCNIVGDIIVDNANAHYIKTKLVDSGKANVTINSYIKILKIVLKWSLQNGYIKNGEVVMNLQKLPDKSKSEKVFGKFLESSEVRTLLDGMKCENWRLLTELLVNTGMRVGECIALTDDDIDPVNDYINVDKTYVQMLQRTDTPKTMSSIRKVNINPDVKRIIFQIRKWSSEIKMITGKRNNIFFVGSEGGYITYDVYEKYLRENSQRLLGRPISAHVLRHTYTSLCAEKGMDILEISEQLGHKNSKITSEIYMHITDERKRKTKEKFNKISLLG